ncbi:MAG TPA: C40 family peptidase [Candidatus Krumholzibacteria bacterium]|nr:C40 family peptidase [Candidatus Krumholzibacteria bacterium]
MGIGRKRSLNTARAVLVAGLIIVGAGCSSSPRFTGSPGRVEPAPEITRTTPPPGGTTNDVDARGNEIVKRAEDYLGTPYRNGGTTSKGVDCSGLTFSVFRSFGIQLPRASRDQARVGDPVPRNELAEGDLIFFGSGDTVSHVGIYAGGGEFIHASTRARSVRFDRLDNKYFRNRYITARRVL